MTSVTVDDRHRGPNWGKPSVTLDPIISSFANPLRRGFRGLGFALVRGDDGNDCSFITRDFNRG
jgi:hypothetical protein